MARTSSLNEFLTDVAESIRTKKGTTDLISPSNFDTEIADIETGADLSEYFNTNPETYAKYWLRDNFNIKYPEVIIPDTWTSLEGFCSNYVGTILPKVVCGNNIKSMKYMYEKTQVSIVDLYVC